MFSPQIGSPTPRPPGLLDDDRPQPPRTQLRPWAPLHRLRPVKIETLTHQLNTYERTVTGLRLIETYFPHALADYGDLSQTGWWEILAHLNNLIEEAGWWEVNWTALNEAWAWWMEDPMENGERMALFLTTIPVRHYGLTQETILKFPPLELLYILLDGAAGVASSDLLIALEWYDAIDQWHPSDRDAVWTRLHAIEANPGPYPETVRWLPELARWACRRTGNHLLDLEGTIRWGDPNQDGSWLRWTSALEVEQTRSAWRRARPVIDQFRRLMTWYEADPNRLSLLADFLMEGINYDHLDW